LTYFSPAKINLFLAITDRRADGFHNLVSLVAPLTWGDALHVEPAEMISLTCDDPALPNDDRNLVVKAANAFVAETGWKGGARLRLEKRIPVGAGLGGGSSNAAVTLCALNQLAGEPLSPTRLAEVAARVGSDCPLFLTGKPSVMRGRGERIEIVPDSAAQRLSGRELLIFKPAFGVSTAWAYGAMAANAPRDYLPADQADARINPWLNGREPAEALLFNNMESVAFRKFPALPVLLERLRELGLSPRMSGSGSACFAFLPQDAPLGAIVDLIQQCWGQSTFIVRTAIA
jgi:4-diphosphocytidyl-2-C-methyl-D-erythritol kinase